MKNQTTASFNASVAESPSESLLEKAINATKHTKRPDAEELLKALSDQALKGAIKWDSNLTRSISEAIKAIDSTLSEQLSLIMHHEKFKKLEGSWRGLYRLVNNSETSNNLKIKLFNVPKEELSKDARKAIDFDQSQLYKKIYENEFGTPGGEPYGVLIGDYQFSNTADDIEMLSKLSNVAAAAFCPFLTAASSQLFGFEDWESLNKPRDLTKIFETPEYSAWRNLRDSEDSRFLVLTLPRVLARLPYGNAKQIDEFDFQEMVNSKDYCWMNSAYVLAERLTNAFSNYGWCTAIRGAEGGGRVENLPLHNFKSVDGDVDSACPTEIGITDRREAELSRLGFLPLCHYKNTNYAVFFGGQTVYKPKYSNNSDDAANAAISARLPFVMATSRFAHYLKCMGRDKIGSFMEAADVEKWLNRWINTYVNSSGDSAHDTKAKYPLAKAKVKVEVVPGKPGAYQAIAWLQPWLQLEELTASLRLVANIPRLMEK
ncbi:MAG: type VI secretion system contractile sheath large subunit [Proteobacteria bacterium]|nr:type VI secretion system contractile sheath large subunit [Pseudomonadota bacterium]